MSRTDRTLMLALAAGALTTAALTGCAGTAAHRPAAEPPATGEADSGPALDYRAACAFARNGEPDLVRASLERAVAADPQHVPSLTWLSSFDYEAGEIERGIARLEPVLASMPDPAPELAVALAVLKMAWGDLEAAAKLLHATTARHPACAAAHANLGFLHLQLGDLELAEAELRAAVALDSSIPEPHLDLAIVHRRRLRFADAARELERAAALDPTLREAQHNLALLYQLYLFDEEQAEAHFRRFLALGGRPDQEVAALFQVTFHHEGDNHR